MPSTVPAVKKGARTWLRTLGGLTGVNVRGAPIPPEALAAENVILGEVTAPQTFEMLDYGPKTERPTLTGWVIVTKPEVAGDPDAGEDAARDRAYQLVGVIETAAKADPTLGGAVAGPGRAELTETALSESAVDLDGTAGRQAQVRFSIAWFSDFTP